MNPGSAPEEKKSSSKFTTYLLIGGLCLLVMGLVWSLDAFFAYTSIGAAVFFFYLAFRNRPAVPLHSTFRRPGNPTVQQARQEAAKQWQQAREKRTTGERTAPSTPQKDQRTIIVAVLFIGFVFTIIFISIIFSETQGVSFDASTYYETGEQFLWSGQFDSAKVYYRRALAIEPDYPEALNGYGNALSGLNDYDSAIVMMNKALEANPDFEYARYSKALVYYYKTEYRKSRSELFSLLRDSPSYYDAMVLAGDDYFVEQRTDSALYWYEQAYSNGVRSAGLSRVMGSIYEQKNNTQRAAELYQESLNYDSTNMDVYNRLNVLLPGREGDVYRRAAKRWKEAGY